MNTEVIEFLSIRSKSGLKLGTKVLCQPQNVTIDDYIATWIDDVNLGFSVLLHEICDWYQTDMK